MHITIKKNQFPILLQKLFAFSSKMLFVKNLKTLKNKFYFKHPWLNIKTIKDQAKLLILFSLPRPYVMPNHYHCPICFSKICFSKDPYLGEFVLQSGLAVSC